MSAARAVAPPGSAIRWNSRQIARCASRIASSVTVTAVPTCSRATAKAMSPTLRVPSESAAMPATSTGTGSPASRALPRHVEVTGSTATTATSLANQAAIPPISPPPPTLTTTVSASGTCWESSRPIVPWPATTSG